MRRSSADAGSHYVREVSLLRDQVPSFDQYPFCLPAIRHLDRLPLHPSVTFIIGENGTGKSTLLEAIAVTWGFNPEGGSRSFNFSTRASHSQLSDFIRLAKSTVRPRDGYFLRAESYFNVATEIERLDAEEEGGPPIIDAYGGRSLHEQSHGESFLALFLNRLGGHGFYILDEPEAALSPTRQMAVIARIHQLVRMSSQFVIATHSPIIMGYPDARIIQLSADGLEPVDYTETEHFFVTREFLNNRERMLKVLLEGGQEGRGGQEG
jgi:predicted ATPase